MNLLNICNKWELGKELVIKQITQGFMNKTYSVNTREQAYILRIYESENDVKRVRREFRLLEYLGNGQLSFHVPTFLIHKGGDYIFQDKGVVAITMPCIAGGSPDLSQPDQAFEAGRALGELNDVLGRLDLNFYEESDRNPSYENYLHFHPAIKNIENVIEVLPTSYVKKRDLHVIFQKIHTELESIYLQLPKQYIHGDCTPGNLLFTDGQISGMIDFEFSCYDVRAMDLAIALGGGPSALWEIDPDLDNIKAFTKGYMSRHQLTELERSAIPFLIRLRRAAMFVYFCARYQMGLDDEGWIRGIVDWVIDCEEWLKSHKGSFLKAIN